MTTIDQPITTQPVSVFAAQAAETWAHRWDVEIHIGTLLAGTPGDPKIVEGYLRSKMRGKSEEAKIAFLEDLRAKVGQEIEDSFTDDMDPEDRGEKVLEELARQGGEIFKRDPDRGMELYEECRKVASMLKEAAIIQWPNKDSGRPAVMHKNAVSWWPEHIFVLGERIYTGRFEADDLLRRVVHTTDQQGRPQSAFAVHEVLHEIRLSFTVTSDVDLPYAAWAKMLARAELGGFGATRSQGYGKFVVTRFDKVS